MIVPDVNLKEASSKAIKQKTVQVAVAEGDGIGPEIMKAVLSILQAAGAGIEPQFIDIGEKVYLSGNTSGITQGAWDAIRSTKVILKSPITTPQGKGYKSLNVTMRKALGLYANIRPSMALAPYVPTHFPKMDVVVVRENEEDLYAGIEHRQTQDVYQCLKLITRPGCERIIRHAFEYARAYDRSKVTCMVKDNIMKLTDGLFHKVFKEIGAEYPEIKQDVQIIDIATARLATRPEDYDVVVTSNLYGDIISDVAAELTGSVGMAGSANIGSEVAMFEAIHGSAPDIAGQNIANPSGLLNGAILMLAHIGQADTADKIKNAWLKTIEDGMHTGDIYSEGFSKKLLKTDEFADEVIQRLGQKPAKLQSSTIAKGGGRIQLPAFMRKREEKKLVGVDVFLDWPEFDANILGEQLDNIGLAGIKLKMITNRGVKVYPNGIPETFCTDHWRCRFVGTDANIAGESPKYSPIDYKLVLQLLDNLRVKDFDVIKTENLYEFNGTRSFSLGQGE